jgi:hypothetical protein
VVNSRLGLAAAHAMLGDKTKGQAYAAEALQQLRGPAIPRAQRTLGYYQAGTIAQRVLKDPPLAQQAWTDGADLVA